MRSTALTIGRRVIASGAAAASRSAPGVADGAATTHFLPRHHLIAADVVVGAGGVMCATRGFASSAASVVTTRGAAATFAARAATVGSVFAASAAFVTAVKLNDVEAIPQAKAAVPKASAPSNSNLPSLPRHNRDRDIRETRHPHEIKIKSTHHLPPPSSGRGKGERGRLITV